MTEYLLVDLPVLFKIYPQKYDVLQKSLQAVKPQSGDIRQRRKEGRGSVGYSLFFIRPETGPEKERG